MNVWHRIGFIHTSNGTPNCLFHTMVHVQSRYTCMCDLSYTEPVKDLPEYHPGARHFDRNLFDTEKTRSEVCPAVPPPEMLVDTLAQEWTDKDVDSGREDMGGEGGRGVRGGGAELTWKSAHGSSASIPS